MLHKENVILSSAYFPNLQYFTKLSAYDDVIIEQYENFSKQSYRNRCEILSPNGKQTLTVPIIKVSGKKQLIKDVKIDYTNNWQDIHFKSLQSSYLSSPFYEFYIDAFKLFFENKYTFLFDSNLKITEILLNEIGMKNKISISKEYCKTCNFPDFRNSIHPKKKFQIKDDNFQEIKYIQVFSNKYNFVPNLSILDLLFNEGPNSENILSQMVK